MSDLPEVGRRIRLIEMPDDPNPIPPGTCGTVTSVNVFASPMPTSKSVWAKATGKPEVTGLPTDDTIAQVEVAWDDGRSMFLVLPQDQYEYIDEES